ncbi:DUF3810 domain-containing protein [Aminipila sp.]|uniref:DUF3810 domain-containing protein n=1 Tax=Aminipila sp. TaxID=2060095 RepID=UPI0028A0B3CD|nr:DUF3810 domain-containing protein [Aminipila sp.]
MYLKLFSFIKVYKYFLLYAGLIPVMCMAFVLAARNSTSLGQLYATNVFPVFPNTFGRLFSVFPFSVLEICIYLLIIGVILFLFMITSKVFTKKGRGKLLARLPGSIAVFLCFCSTVFLILTLTCSINYSRDGIAKDIGITVSPSSHEDLVKLCLLLIDDINEISSSSPINEALTADSLKFQSKQAMINLGKKHSSLSGYYPNPKPVIMSSWMSDINMTGLFSPYTIEANYNNDVVDYIKPYTICHELAHLKGYICEDDAGFIAYLACSDSDSAALRYSGAMNALSFALNALYQDSTEEEYKSIVEKLPEKALFDLTENQNYWERHEGSASRISTAVNDNYLKANAQADGIKSYGRIVDLLLSYYGLNSNQLV